MSATIREDGAGTRRDVRATLARRLGANARTTYGVRLTRRCAVVAVGTLRGSSLVLRVRATGSKPVLRGGRRVTVATYPRLRGGYRMQPTGQGPRIAVTALTIRSTSTG